MRQGMLEVLLVDADGLRHTNFIGRSAYYVIIQCGSKVHRSKLSRGEHGQAWWNQKFTFEFSLSDWKHTTRITFRIMDKHFFRHGGFVGQSIINLKGIITEGINRGVLEVKPTPHSVVLEDDTFRGEIKIGFKFITNKELLMKRKDFHSQANEPKESLSGSIVNFWKFSWLRILFYYYLKISKNGSKTN